PTEGNQQRCGVCQKERQPRVCRPPELPNRSSRWPLLQVCRQQESECCAGQPRLRAVQFPLLQWLSDLPSAQVGFAAAGCGIGAHFLARAVVAPNVRRPVEECPRLPAAPEQQPGRDVNPLLKSPKRQTVPPHQCPLPLLDAHWLRPVLLA